MKKKLDFEEAMVRLSDIVEALESGSLSLNESISLYREGMELSVFCSNQVEKAEGKVQLLRKDRNDKFILKDFEE